MRVAIFSETFLPKIDGISRVICLLVDHLHRRNIEVMIVAPRLGEPVVTDYNGSKVITVSGMVMPWYPEARITPPSPTVYREMKAFQPDVAHFLHPVTVGLPGLLIAKQMGIATLTSFHLDFARIAHHMNYGPINLGFLEGATDFLTRLVFNWADYSLAPSKKVQRDMLQLGIAEVGLWKRGVDGEKFNPRFYSDAMRERLSEGHPDDALLLYVGRLSPEKHLHLLKEVLLRVPGTRLALVGDGPSREDLKAHFAGTPAHFVGYLHGEELSQAYASADLFAFPSSLETFGLVVTEAMAAGIPVVASRVGGIPDVVEEGKTGYTFEIGDADGLVDGVRRLISDRARMKEMGKLARAYAETQAWEHMMDEVIEHYQRIIDKRRAAHTRGEKNSL